MLSDTRRKGAALRGRPSRPVPRERSTVGELTPMKGGGFIGLATKSGAFVPADVLDLFAGKQTSQQLTQTQDFAGLQGLVEPLFDPANLALHMEANTYHARAVKTKAQDVAGQGWELLPLVDNPSEEERESLLNFFDSLEEDLSQILIQAMTDRESVGWLSIELVRKDKAPDGPIVFLRNIPAHTMRAHKDGEKYVQVRGTRKVWFKTAGLTGIDVDKNTGLVFKSGELDAEDRANEVLWNNIYTARSDVYGVPDHIPAIGAILGDIARRDYNIVFFENFGVPAYAVMISGDYDPGEPIDDNGNTQLVLTGPPIVEQVGDLKTPLHRQIEGHLQEIAANPHSVLLLGIPSNEGGEVEITFEKLAVEVKEASFRLYRLDNAREVLSAHAVPPYRAGIAEQGSLGGNVAEQTDKIYRDSVIAPRQSMLERLMNRFVLSTYEGEDWSFSLLAIDVEDEILEMELAIALFDHGGLTPNDLIRTFGGRYDIVAQSNMALDAHYINGVAIDAAVSTEVESIMLSLRAGLLEIASKHAESSDEDGTISSQLFGILASLEAGAGALGNGGASNGDPEGSHAPGGTGGLGSIGTASRAAKRDRAIQRAIAASNNGGGDGDA